jgi:hypothetical protein
MDTQLNFVYSILETTAPDGSKYNIISSSGAQVQSEFKTINNNGWYGAVNVHTAFENFKSDGITLSGDNITPVNYLLSTGIDFVDSISVYLGAGHEELPLAETLTASTSSLHKLAFETATVGMKLMAKSRLAFGTIIDLHLITAYKTEKLSGVDSEFNYGLGGSNRFDFNTRSGNYGFICGFEISNYGVPGVSTSRMSQAHGGLYYNYRF